MADHPILFSGEMVRAILVGRKTVTRRIAWQCDIHHDIRKKMPSAPVKWAGAVYPARESGWVSWYPGKEPLNGISLPEFTKQQYAKGFECPYGKPGDRLWVRETWRAVEQDDMVDGVEFRADSVFYSIENSPQMAEKWCEAYSNGKWGDSWRPSIFMPRWASRITLEIIGVRVERLQEITEADAIAEGIQWTEEGPLHAHYLNEKSGGWFNFPTGREAFAELWDDINGKRASWKSNPFVWVIEFKPTT